MKVGGNALSLSSGICQNPELASKVENTRAPTSCARDCSTAGRGCLSRLTLLLRWVRSTQMQTFPLPFGTITISAHQSVGSLILVITPSLSKFIFHWLHKGNGNSARKSLQRVWFPLPVGLCTHHPVRPTRFAQCKLCASPNTKSVLRPTQHSMQ